MTATETAVLRHGSLDDRLAILVAEAYERFHRSLGQYHYHARRRLSDDVRRVKNG